MVDFASRMSAGGGCIQEGTPTRSLVCIDCLIHICSGCRALHVALRFGDSLVQQIFHSSIPRAHMWFTAVSCNDDDQWKELCGYVIDLSLCSVVMYRSDMRRIFLLQRLDNCAVSVTTDKGAGS
jgi:hypothetical protein